MLINFNSIIPSINKKIIKLTLNQFKIIKRNNSKLSNSNSKMSNSDNNLIKGLNITHNPYFNISGQDIWSLINETAAKAEIESGEKVCNLGQGFFSYSPPDFAINFAKNAFDDPLTNQYAPPRGKPQLLNSLAKSYSKFTGQEIKQTEICVTTGANEGMLSCFTAFLQKNDEVIVLEPFFDQYISNIELNGGIIKYLPINPPADFDKRTVDASEWTIDFKQLESLITSKTKMIVINTPHNPIGKNFSKEELLKIGELAVKHDFLIVSDEVYEHLYYKEHIRISTLSDEISKRTLTIGSAGKTFAATGWRIGWVIGNEELIKYVQAAHTRICFSTPAPIQIAVANSLDAALENDYYESTRKNYINKYKIFTSIFDELNLPYTIADGGYFLLVNFKKIKIPENIKFPEIINSKPRDFKLAFWFIKEFGVVGIPPTEFYTDSNKEAAKDCLRFAVCKDDDVLEDAVKRLRALKKYIIEE